MRLRITLVVGVLGLVSVLGALRAQKPFKEYPGIEYENFELPKDWNQKTEWVRARLRYPDVVGYPQRLLFYDNGKAFPGYWTMDYPRSDRHLLAGVRRVTRLDTRSVEEVVSPGGTGGILQRPDR